MISKILSTVKNSFIMKYYIKAGGFKTFARCFAYWSISSMLSDDYPLAKDVKKLFGSYLPYREELIKTLRYSAAMAALLVWSPVLRKFTGRYMMGLSLLAIPIFIPLDYYFGEGIECEDYEYRKKWSLLTTGMNVILVFVGLNHYKGYDLPENKTVPEVIKKGKYS